MTNFKILAILWMLVGGASASLSQEFEEQSASCQSTLSKGISSAAHWGVVGIKEVLKWGDWIGYGASVLGSGALLTYKSQDLYDMRSRDSFSSGLLLSSSIYCGFRLFLLGGLAVLSLLSEEDRPVFLESLKTTDFKKAIGVFIGQNLLFLLPGLIENHRIDSFKKKEFKGLGNEKGLKAEKVS